MIERLKEDILSQDGLNSKKYEYKTFETSPAYKGMIFLYTVVGRKNDQGTMAAVLCRSYRHIVVGKRGKVQSLRGKKVSGYSRVLIHGVEN